MPAQIIWSVGSVADLTAIVSWITADNPPAAQRTAREIQDKVGQIAAFPLSGRHYDFTPRGEIRELVISPYRVFYRIEHDQTQIRILRIWHSARGLPRLPRN